MAGPCRCVRVCRGPGPARPAGDFAVLLLTPSGTPQAACQSVGCDWRRKCPTSNTRGQRLLLNEPSVWQEFAISQNRKPHLVKSAITKKPVPKIPGRKFTGFRIVRIQKNFCHTAIEKNFSGVADFSFLRVVKSSISDL
jgi:hypothetical protein